ncbi:hypothetical protein BJ912DRAFT_250559 [Pholiota molesta]|nr:hypothetical protein BJ912DRAFT_250559 [Pholiota molesta]
MGLADQSIHLRSVCTPYRALTRAAMLDSNMKIIFRLLRAKPRPTPLLSHSARAKQDRASYISPVLAWSVLVRVYCVCFVVPCLQISVFFSLLFSFFFLIFHSVVACAHAPAARPRMGMAGLSIHRRIVCTPYRASQALQCLKCTPPMPSAPSCDRRRWPQPHAKRAHAQYSLALPSPCLVRVSAYSLCHGLVTFTVLITVYVSCRDDDGGARPLHAPRSEPPRVCTRYHILKTPSSNPILHYPLSPGPSGSSSSISQAPARTRSLIRGGVCAAYAHACTYGVRVVGRCSCLHSFNRYLDI